MNGTKHTNVIFYKIFIYLFIYSEESEGELIWWMMMFKRSCAKNQKLCKVESHF